MPITVALSCCRADSRRTLVFQTHTMGTKASPASIAETCQRNRLAQGGNRRLDKPFSGRLAFTGNAWPQIEQAARAARNSTTVAAGLTVLRQPSTLRTKPQAADMSTASARA